MKGYSDSQKGEKVKRNTKSDLVFGLFIVFLALCIIFMLVVICEDTNAEEVLVNEYPVWAVSTSGDSTFQTVRILKIDLLTMMSEGLPGGVVVLTKLMEDPAGIQRVLDLDDMNIRGTQIWIGFKDHCGEDIEKFKTAIKERDPQMVDAINKEGLRGNHEHKAVAHGASFGERSFLEQKEK